MEKERESLMLVGDAVVCDSVTTRVIDSANFSPISVKKLFIVLQIAIGRLSSVVFEIRIIY